ncbi:MAG: cell division protein FtsL [Desulfobacteraceae bacterium]|jgi:cell division protein FtsL
MTHKPNVKKASGKKITWVWATILVIFIGELFFYTWCRVQCVQVGMGISAERRKQEQLKTMRNSLKIELARLKAPERISYIARKKLGLDMPEPSKTIMVP